MSAMWEGKRVENQTLMKHDDAVVGELRRSAQEVVLDGDTLLHDPSLVPFEAWQQPRGFHVEVQFVRVPVFFCHACARGVEESAMCEFDYAQSCWQSQPARTSAPLHLRVMRAFLSTSFSMS